MCRRFASERLTRNSLSSELFRFFPMSKMDAHSQTCMKLGKKITKFVMFFFFVLDPEYSCFTMKSQKRIDLRHVINNFIIEKHCDAH